jgi:hypothetical protein
MKEVEPTLMVNSMRQIICSALLLGVLSFSASRALADEPNDYLHTRTYVGILGTSVSVDNSTLFNGQHYSRMDYPAYEIDLIPKLDQSFGLGLLVGHREEAYAVELSYWQSSHNASFGPASVSSTTSSTPVDIPLAHDSAVVHSVNLDFKRYFFTELQTQPFINLGVSFPWIAVNHGAEDVAGNFSSLTLAGLGLNLGIGVEYYLTPNFSVLAGATERWASFDQAKGFGVEFSTLTPYGGTASDGGSGLDFTLGTTIGFQ